jgi:hypothetical protein
VTGGWRRLHNEELHNLYASQNIIGVIKPRMMRWEGQLENLTGTGKGKAVPVFN